MSATRHSVLRHALLGNRTCRLFVLDMGRGRIVSMNTDGSDAKTVVSGCRLPNGMIVDVEGGHVFWSGMGMANRNDGTIERADLDGRNRRRIIPEGVIFTPKKMFLDGSNRKLYWSDREGMRIMRANLDGSHMETLVETGRGESDRRITSNWCLGVVVDVVRQHIYWSQEGRDKAVSGRLLRAGIKIPRGETAATRTDITTLFEHLSHPIDLEFDSTNRMLYWIDRGPTFRRSTVNRTPIDGDVRHSEVLGDLMEGVSISLDVAADRMYVTEQGGSIYSSRLDGSDKCVVAIAQGSLVAIACADVQSQAGLPALR
jgi:hypothetical protein